MKKVWMGLCFFSVLALLLCLQAGGQAVCERQEVGRFQAYGDGDNSKIGQRDGITDEDGLVLRLNQKGANFTQSANYPVTTNWRMTGASADVNGDGLYDLIEGGRNCDQYTYQAGDTNISLFTCLGTDPGNPLRFVFSSPYYINYLSTFSTFEIIALGAGDFNGDGDADIAALSWMGRLWIFENYYVENNHSPGDTPDFDNSPTLVGNLINDSTSEYSYTSDGPHFRWESNIEAVDIDGDRDLDLIVGVPQRYAWSRWGEVVIYINNGSGTFSRLPQVINPYPNNDTYRYGVCGVAAADFDGDGDVDFYVGAANSRDIYFYRNNAGNFSQISSKTIRIPASRGSCTYLRQGDVDNDGDIDMVLATDGWTANPPGGYVFWFANDGTATFTQNSVPPSGARVSSSGDLDSGAIGDFDGDGDLDFFVADGNDSRNCYFFMNEVYPTYVARGTVSSINLIPCNFIVSDQAIVAATIWAESDLPGQTTVTYYLSNSDNENGTPRWEGPVTSGVEFEFESPGDFLRWQAIFTSADERVTPRVRRVWLSYKYIEKREYSRTSHAVTKVEIDSAHTGEEEVLYSASFQFPKWKGHLRSWDVTTLDLSPNRGSVLKDILDANAQPLEDAGEILAARSYSTRIVFTAHDGDSDGQVDDRFRFEAAAADILDDYLDLGIGSPEVEPLIRFVLGDGRAWKLGDINHSSPKVLIPPNEAPNLMGTGYQAFKNAHQNRRVVVLAGANDGMLHCFDAATLDELWAFIPHNLLYKLKRMKVVDPDCGEFLNHHFFVDGTPTIKDVYFGNQWHTVLVCGQGAGWGLNHKCYYFALEITDPLNPQPLWEFTDQYMGETWSVPAIAKIEATDRWVVFFGSGYDNDGDPTENIGHYFYAVDVENGSLLRSFEIAEQPEPASPFGIQNTLPGSPTVVDIDNDGYADAVYFGDLKGRMWKIDLTDAVRDWEPAVIYQDPYMHPIITKPAAYADMVEQRVRLYFGTGGDDRAPGDGSYSILALVDGTLTSSVEWYIGPADLGIRLSLPGDARKGEFNPGERVWADPVLSDRIVYIATLTGSIEALNPCLTLTGQGRIYARYILGNQAGGSALLTAEGATIPYLETKQKVRSAVTTGETQVVTSGEQTLHMRKVFIQSYTQPGEGGPEPPSQVLAQPTPQTALLIRSWREVYKVLKIRTI